MQILNRFLKDLFGEKQRFIIFNLEHGYYISREDSGWDMYSFGNFFTADATSIGHWIEFLDDPEDDCYTSNWSMVVKDEHSDYISVIAEHEDRRYAPYPVPEDHIVKIKSSELRKLLYQWQELRSRDPRPPKIKITEKRGVFNMEAVE